MKNFDAAVALILKLEGGYSNHPSDKGGPTKYGITLRTLSKHRGESCSERDVENLTEDEAAQIYLAYWNEVPLGRVTSKRVAMILFAHVIHTGSLSAVKALQKTLNQYFDQRVFVDGIFGAHTELVLAQATTKNEDLLCRKLIQSIQTFYVDICLGNETQLVFLKGWMNRSFAVLDAITP